MQVDRWWDLLLPILAPSLYTAGGCIIMIQVLSAMLFPSQYIFTYLKKFWFVHKCPIVLCRLRMSMDHLEVIMCIYITCLIQSGNTSGIMSSCTTNSNPNKYLKPTFFFLYSLCILSPTSNPHCWFMLLLSYTTDGAAVENLENGSLQGCGVYTGVSNQ